MDESSIGVDSRKDKKRAAARPATRRRKELAGETGLEPATTGSTVRSAGSIAPLPRRKVAAMYHLRGRNASEIRGFLAWEANKRRRCVRRSHAKLHRSDALRIARRTAGYGSGGHEARRKSGRATEFEKTCNDFEGDGEFSAGGARGPLGVQDVALEPSPMEKRAFSASRAKRAWVTESSAIANREQAFVNDDTAWACRTRAENSAASASARAASARASAASILAWTPSRESGVEKTTAAPRQRPCPVLVRPAPTIPSRTSRRACPAHAVNGASLRAGRFPGGEDFGDVFDGRGGKFPPEHGVLRRRRDSPQRSNRRAPPGEGRPTASEGRPVRSWSSFDPASSRGGQRPRTGGKRWYSATSLSSARSAVSLQCLRAFEGATTMASPGRGAARTPTRRRTIHPAPRHARRLGP